MVRFIIKTSKDGNTKYMQFTFQYGQIYYLKIALRLLLNNEDLHSNMVRFIIGYKSNINSNIPKFTFQYGQIYYRKRIERQL